MMVGSILAATDPVAVVSILKEVGASKILGHVIEGESLVNDGTAIVVFTLFFEISKGEQKTGVGCVCDAFNKTVGGFTRWRRRRAVGYILAENDFQRPFGANYVDVVCVL